MSALAQRIFLTFAWLASLVCAIWIAITIWVVFLDHSAQPSVTFILPVIALGGAAAVGFKFYYDERRGVPTFSTERELDVQDDDGRLLSTPLRAGIAVGLTAFVLFLAVRDVLHPSVASESPVPFRFMLRGAALVVVNAVFWLYLAWLAFRFIRGTRERERVVMIGWASLLLTPLERVWPDSILLVRYIVVLALLIALLAAISVWVRPLSAGESVDEER